jgi:hypothetical protein
VAPLPQPVGLMDREVVGDTLVLPPPPPPLPTGEGEGREEVVEAGEREGEAGEGEGERVPPNWVALPPGGPVGVWEERGLSLGALEVEGGSEREGDTLGEEETERVTVPPPPRPPPLGLPVGVTAPGEELPTRESVG